jgi:phage-related holin
MPEFTALFGTSQMQIIVWLVVADVVLGIVSALIRKDFSFRKLGNFMHGHMLGYVFSFAVVELIGQALPVFSMFVQVVFYLVVVVLAVSILRNLGRFGLPVPAFFSK